MFRQNSAKFIPFGVNILTNPTNCGLQYSIKTSFRSVQVAGYSLLLELIGEVT